MHPVLPAAPAHPGADPSISVKARVPLPKGDHGAPPSQVHSLPLDMIKIDQGLSRALATDPGARALVGTIVALSWQLGIDCTIEGVEDEAQAATARALGVRLMQGYHFGRPKPAADALAEAVRTTRTA